MNKSVYEKNQNLYPFLCLSFVLRSRNVLPAIGIRKTAEKISQANTRAYTDTYLTVRHVALSRVKD